jgi:hypothetical protein
MDGSKEKIEKRKRKSPPAKEIYEMSECLILD